MASNAQFAVTVCICTFRRTSLALTLDSVASQILPEGVDCRIIVVDNDVTPSARPLVAAFLARRQTALDYVHAPSHNISTARNAGLNACRTPWLAFVDDDETVAVNWLDRLLASRDDAAAVFGRCEAIYADGTPKWIRLGDYHSNRITPRNGVIETGYTSNVLMDMNFVRRFALQFDTALGRTGGEDTLFFHAMHRLGGRLVYAQDAVAYEQVAETRATARWVVMRRYRAGQTYAMLQQKYDSKRYRSLVLSSPIKIAFCAAIAVALALRPSRAMWWLMRGVFHCGMLNYRLTRRLHQEYAG